MERRRIIVAGMPRTGTSWLAKALSHAPRFTYYREPDNWEHVDGAEPYFPRLYLPSGSDDGNYRLLMERALNGKLATGFTMIQDPGPLLNRLPRRWRRRVNWPPILYLRKRHVLVKLVYSNLALDWLHEHFPEAQQVYVMRHPCGQFASWQRLGWTPDPHELLESEPLVHDYLEPFAALIRSARTFWEKAGALWGATNLVVAKQRERRPARVILQFEWLCEDPLSRFRSLYNRLDLAWTPAARHFLEQHDRRDDRSYSMQRRSREEIDRWRSELSARDIEECRRFAEPFGLPFYPDFQPTPRDPLWQADTADGKTDS